MRKIDHFVGGASYASGERQGDVFDPNNGGVQAKVGFGTRRRSRARRRRRARGASRPGRRPTRSAAPG